MNPISILRLNTRLIAHRGLSGLETENTAAAFVAAGNRSYYGVETDVRKTSDGHFMIIHDDNTLRVGGIFYQIEKTKLGKLQSLTLKDTNGIPRSDLRIPTLEEYIRICKHYQKVCFLEFKPLFSKQDLEKMIAIIKKQGYLKQVVFISFSLENLTRLRELLPDQPAQLLMSEAPSGAKIAELREHGLGLACRYTEVTKRLVNDLHQQGIKLNCWTCDDPKAAEILCSWGVDYLTTNILE